MGEYSYYLFFRFKKLNWQSFLIDQSKEYIVAFILCLIELFSRRALASCTMVLSSPLLNSFLSIIVEASDIPEHS